MMSLSLQNTFPNRLGIMLLGWREKNTANEKRGICQSKIPSISDIMHNRKK